MSRNRQSVKNLQSHFILTMSHWSSGLPVCFPSQGTRVQIPRWVLMWNRHSPVSVVSLQVQHCTYLRLQKQVNKVIKNKAEDTSITVCTSPVNITDDASESFSLKKLTLSCKPSMNLGPGILDIYTVPKAAHISEKYLRVYMGASPLASKFPKAV